MLSRPGGVRISTDDTVGILASRAVESSLLASCRGTTVLLARMPTSTRSQSFSRSYPIQLSERECVCVCVMAMTTTQAPVAMDSYDPNLSYEERRLLRRMKREQQRTRVSHWEQVASQLAKKWLVSLVSLTMQLASQLLERQSQYCSHRICMHGAVPIQL